ncbi:MAG TPA: transposase [Ramlibacter sp.]|nr:transposase [Ramlibacter sp.]
MARLARLIIPGLPHHLIQRGNNGHPLFAGPEDRAHMHGLLVEHAREAKVAVHGYVLLDSQFHLLATPAQGDSLARLMQAVGRRYVRYFNAKSGRSGTLWEGRYRCAPLQPERFLLPCMVFLDLAPQRAGLTEDPAQYPWSSCGQTLGQRADRLVTQHPLFWRLGNTPFARESAYAALLAQGLPAPMEHRIADSALHGWALGDEAFLGALQAQTGRRLTRGQPGRPRNVAVAADVDPSPIKDG